MRQARLADLAPVGIGVRALETLEFGGCEIQNRAQAHGTYKFLLNGLLYPAGS